MNVSHVLLRTLRTDRGALPQVEWSRDINAYEEDWLRSENDEAAVVRDVEVEVWCPGAQKNLGASNVQKGLPSFGSTEHELLIAGSES